jgi:hypothetical protein
MKKLLILFALLAYSLPAQRTKPTFIKAVTGTIAESGNLSGAIDLKLHTVVMIVMPPSWVTANLTFQCSVDGGAYTNVYEVDGTEWTVTAAASRAIQIAPEDLTGCGFIKIRSGTSGSPVTQTSAAVFLVLTRPW